MSDHKRLAALEARIRQLEQSGLKTGEAINQVQFEETTQKVGDLIRQGYDAIVQAKKEAYNNKAPKEVFGKLDALKRDVPKKYAISQATMKELNDILNEIVGGQSS